VLEVVDLIDDGTGDISNTFVAAVNTPIVGVGSSEYAPIATALILTLTTPNFIKGRRVKGRIFFSPVAQNMVQADGTPAATALAFVAAGGAGVLNDLDEGDQWVVWHRPKGAVEGLACPISACTVRDVFGILRSRRD
jgi:hypothetical protein